MTLNPRSDLRQLRDERIDWLLSVLTGVLILLIFVFAPLQAIGISAFHLFAIGLLLAIIGGMVIISSSPHGARFDVDCPCCQCCRIFPAALLPGTLPPSHIGRRVADHRLHSGDRGHSGRIQGEVVSRITGLSERSFCTC